MAMGLGWCRKTRWRNEKVKAEKAEKAEEAEKAEGK